MIKKVLIILTLVLMINFSYAGYTKNDTYTNMTLESNGWCANLEIIFQIWNQSDFEDQEDYEDNICEIGCEEDCDWDSDPDCVECDRNCYEFDFIDGATVKIYDGPLDSLPLLFEGTTNDTGHFKYTFDKPQRHLLEIWAEDDTHYNDFHEIYDLYECGAAQGKTIVTTIEPEDYTFTYDNQGVTLDVKGSLMNESSDFVIDEGVSMPKALENTVKHFELTATSANFSSIVMKIKVDKLSDNNTITKLKRYAPSTKNWVDTGFNNLVTEISFDASPLGVYAITQVIEEPVVEDIVEEQINDSASEDQASQDEEPEEEEDTPIASNQLTPLMSNNNLIIVGVVGACLLLLIIVFVSKSKSSSGHYHEKRDAKDAPTEEEKKVLTTYEATYQQAKKYVQEHKDGFSKDALYRALEGASVPKDIIDKVFNEEY